MPTFGSLFAGIGGIDLGLERAGWTGRWQVEYEPFCQRVLAKHWPDVTRYGDIHDVDWSGVEPVDLIAGGFPCQPFSVAGRQRGMDDDRWLWPEFERCLRALRPRFVLVENVPGLLVGRGMDAVLGGLAGLGYDTEWECIPASFVGAPHLRYRVWIIGTQQSGVVADAGSGWRQNDRLRAGRNESRASDAPMAYADELGGLRDGGLPVNGHTPHGDDSDRRGGPPDVAHADGHGQGRATALGPSSVTGLRPGEARAEPHGPGDGTLADAAGGRREWRWAEPVTPEGRRTLGVPPRSDEGVGAGWWESEPDVGRVAHGVPARVDRLRSLGNAVVPQVVEFIGRRILEAEALT